MSVWLAVLAGIGLGYAFERGDFCFHSTWRGVFSRPSNLSLFQAYLVVLVASIPVVQLLVATDVIDPFIPAFAWKATVFGGLIFGVGMVVAQTCITGMFYKLGHGMLGVVVALVTWAIGDLVTYRGPLSSLRESLNEDPITATVDGVEHVATVDSLFGLPGWVALALVGGLAVGYLGFRATAPNEPRGQLLGWLPLGLLTTAALTVGWLLARWHGFDYSFGTSGVPNQVWGSLAGDDVGSMWIPLGLVSLIPGALLAAWRSGTLWVRGESARRFGELAVGGFLMGIGAGIAGGCNLGHAMVGVPLLSVGSISATLAMIAGVGLAVSVRRLGSGS